MCRSGNGDGKRSSEQVGCDSRREPFYPVRPRRRATGPPPHLPRITPAIVLWPRPPLGTPFALSPSFIGCRSRPSSISPSPLAPLPRYPLPEFPIGSGHTLSFVTGLRLQSGFLPQPSFIHSSSSAGCLRHGGESTPSLPSRSSGCGEGTPRLWEPLRRLEGFPEEVRPKPSPEKWVGICSTETFGKAFLAERPET